MSDRLALLRSLHVVTAMVVLALAAAHAPADEAQAAPPELEEWLPENVFVVGRVNDLGANLESFLASEFLGRLQDSPGYQRLQREGGYKDFESGLEQIRAVTGQPADQLIRQLFGARVVFGLQPAFGMPTWIALSRGAEGGMQQALDRLRSPTEQRLGAWPFPEEERHEGHAIHGAGQFHYAVVQDTLVLSSDVSEIRAVIDIASGKSVRTLKASADFELFRSELSCPSLAVMCSKRLEFIQQQIPALADDFVGGLLTGSWLKALRGAEFLTLRLLPGHERLELDFSARAKGLGAQLACFFPSTTHSRVLAALADQPLLSWVRIHRDFPSYWSGAEGMVKPEGLGGMKQFDQIMSLMFGGKDMITEVLPELAPTVTVISHRQSYDGLPGRPLPAIPGFAGIFEVRNPGSFGRGFLVALQSLVAIANFDLAEKGKAEDVLLVEPETIEGVTIYTANRAYPPAASGALGMEYNFTPALAIVGDHVVIASTRETARMVVGQLVGSRAPATAVAERQGDDFFVDGVELKKILQDNAEVLAANQVLEKGLTIEQARAELQGALDLLTLLRDLRMETRLEGDTLRVRTVLRLTGGTI